MTRHANKEIEVKFTCDAETLHAVLEAEILPALVSRQQKILHATYFDTSSFSLRKSNSVLRMRKTNGGEPVLCFKAFPTAKATTFHRLEIEVPAPDGHVDLSLFDAATAKHLKRLSEGRPLQALFDVTVERRSVHVVRQGAEIEISADVGEVTAGTKSSNIAELELELKSGDEAGLYDLAAQLADEFPLSLSFLNKSERGFHLIGKSRSAPPAIPAIKLSPDMSMDDVIQTTLSHALYQITANWDDLTEDRSVEAVHQMRLGLRRFRIFLSTFSLAYPCGEFDALRKEGRAIAQTLGTVRSLDVLTQFMAKLPLTTKFTKRDVKSIQAIITRRRALAAKEAIALFKSETAARFVLHAQSLIATKAWGITKASAEPFGLGLSPQKFSVLALDRLYKRVRLRGRRFEKLSVEQLHSLRLALKALSSTAGGFAGLTKKRKNAADFEAALLHLQQGLGQLNDCVFALEFCNDIVRTEASAERKAGKQLAHRLKSKQASLQSKLQKRWTAFKKSKPYWT